MIVLDASVVIKWFKPDETSDVAEQLLQEHLAGREAIFIPSLLVYEFTNALWYSKRLTVKEIEEALLLLDSIKINYIGPDRALLAEALRVSEQTRLSIYDASYVVLAKRFSCRLYSADKKLYEKVRSLIEIVLI